MKSQFGTSGPIHLLMVTNRLAPGGAEQMLVRLALQLDPRLVRPVVLCLKDPGPWAERLRGRDVPLHAHLLAHKYDFRVIGRIRRLIEQYSPAVVMAVGNGGDRMFWSTLAAPKAGAGARPTTRTTPPV